MKKKAAMEMSVGTIVTIVLLMTVLILGLFLVRTIFRGAVENIDGIDQAVKNEITKLFSEDSSRKIVIYPPTRKISIKKGEEGKGFGLSIRNVLGEDAKFSYEISAQEIKKGCDMRLSEAEDLIGLGREGRNIQLGAGNKMADPILVSFDIPETAPPCQIKYSLTVFEGSKGGPVYGSSVDVILTIKPE